MNSKIDLCRHLIGECNRARFNKVACENALPFLEDDMSIHEGIKNASITLDRLSCGLSRQGMDVWDKMTDEERLMVWPEYKPGGAEEDSVHPAFRYTVLWHIKKI